MSRFRLALVLLLFLASLWNASYAQLPPPKKPPFVVKNFCSGWTHDDLGYHPAIFLTLDTNGNTSLSGRTVRFQARFTDLHPAEVATGRKDVRWGRGRGIFVYIECPYTEELGRDPQQWPQVEIKVMARVASGANLATTEADHVDLLLTRLEKEVRTPEDAEKSLYSDLTTFQRPSRSNVRTLLGSRDLPGLGDDFTAFEDRFREPQEIDASLSDWTWVRYYDQASETQVVVGSRGRGGPVDLVMIALRKSEVAADPTALPLLAQSFAGKYKGQSLGPLTRTLRYLPTGREQLFTRKAQNYYAIGVAPKQSEEKFVVILSRLKREPEDLMQWLRTQAILKLDASPR